MQTASLVAWQQPVPLFFLNTGSLCCGVCSHGLYSYGLYSYGPDHDGLCSYGLYSYDRSKDSRRFWNTWPVYLCPNYIGPYQYIQGGLGAGGT